MQNKRIIILTIGFAGFFILCGALYIVLKVSRAKTLHVYTPSNTERAVLKRINQDFNTAEVFRFQNDYSQALNFYKKALPQAKDLSQEAQIKYDIALMTELGGRYAEAIQLYKEIINTNAYYPIIRASAVQSIAGMHYSYYDAYDLVVKETFKDLPFRNFYKNESTSELNISYRKLYEYGLSIYPLSLSAARVAGFYQQHVFTVLKGSTTTPDGMADVSLALENLNLAQKDIVRISNDPVESLVLPQIYIRLGLIYGALDEMGVVHSGVTEEYFQKGMQLATVHNAKPGSFNAYLYASYLVRTYGAKRSDDIKKLLAPFKKENSSNISPGVNEFFTSTLTNKDLTRERGSLKLLGQLDPDFKTYLLTRGWRQIDFANAVKN